MLFEAKKQINTIVQISQQHPPLLLNLPPPPANVNILGYISPHPYLCVCVCIYIYISYMWCMHTSIYTYHILCVYVFTYLKVFVILLLNGTYQLIKKLAFSNSSFKPSPGKYIYKCNLFYA